MITHRRSTSLVRVLVVMQHSEIGGAQINALEFAEEMSRRPGYELILYLPDGVLVARARTLGLEMHVGRLQERAPSARRSREIWRIARQRRVDIVHTYEWAPTIDAYFTASTLLGIPVVTTHYSMDFPYPLPDSVPIVLGTRELRDRGLREGKSAFLIEPPVDIEMFRPGGLPPSIVDAARTECGAGDADCLVVVVGRIAELLKLDGLIALVHAVGEIAKTGPVRLAVIGDGNARARVEAAATQVNCENGRRVVTLLGSRSDPRPYYLAADIAVGMGSSALRALACGKPLLVQGEKAFWAVLDERTYPTFAAQGWYGIGDGEDSIQKCVAELCRLVGTNSRDRESLGRFGREVVVSRYSLPFASDQLHNVYQEFVNRPSPRLSVRLREALWLSTELVKLRVSVRFPALSRFIRRLRRR